MNAPAEEMLVVEEQGEGVILLRLNRPDKRNALATQLLAMIADALVKCAEDPDVRCAVITGSDRIFAAGADIAELAGKDVAGALADRRPVLWAVIRDFPKPLVAAVEGWCLGAGNELLMCCDIAVAGSSAKFGQPETNLGIIPGAGGTATLPRLIGRAAAMKMVLLGEPIDAETALSLGLIAEVQTEGQALNRALVIAKKIADRAPLAMRQGKAMINAAFDLPHGSHLRAERQAFAALFGSLDRTEGIAAFQEKRSPLWRGS